MTTVVKNRYAYICSTLHDRLKEYYPRIEMFPPPWHRFLLQTRPRLRWCRAQPILEAVQQALEQNLRSGAPPEDQPEMKCKVND